MQELFQDFRICELELIKVIYFTGPLAERVGDEIGFMTTGKRILPMLRACAEYFYECPLKVEEIPGTECLFCSVVDATLEPIER